MRRSVFGYLINLHVVMMIGSISRPPSESGLASYKQITVMPSLKERKDVQIRVGRGASVDQLKTSRVFIIFFLRDDNSGVKRIISLTRHQLRHLD